MLEMLNDLSLNYLQRNKLFHFPCLATQAKKLSHRRFFSFAFPLGNGKRNEATQREGKKWVASEGNGLASLSNKRQENNKLNEVSSQKKHLK